MTAVAMGGPCEFVVGAQEVNWAWNYPGAWMISESRLRRRVGPLRPARAGNVIDLDSGGFSFLSANGEWPMTAKQWAEKVRRYSDELGGIRSAAIMDWMTEPEIRLGGRFGNQYFVGTGKTTREHLDLTVGSYFDLMALDDSLPWLPTLQGETIEDYLLCAELYDRRGVDLTRSPIVGVGSVCRKQSTTAIEEIVREITGMGITAHWFGVKTLALTGPVGHLMYRVDSMAWSERARKGRFRMEGCTHRAQYCNNCPRWAMRWGNQLRARRGVATLSEEF